MTQSFSRWLSDPLTVDEVWPTAYNDLTAHTLQRLDGTEFRELCRRVRQRIIARGGSNRHADHIVRRLKNRRTPRDGVLIPHKLLARKMKSFRILDSLVPDRERRWVQPLHRRQNIEIDLESFSFIDNPLETIDRLQEIAISECRALSAVVNFKDSRILDIGPYVVLSLMRSHMIPFMSGGEMSRPVMKVIEAVGLRHPLGMGRFKFLRDQLDVWAFEMYQRRPAGMSTSTDIARQPSTKEKVADTLVDTIDDWLRKLNFPMELSKIGRAHLASLTTEILDNAERHSHLDGDGNWAVAGFMARRENADDETYTCHLAFISIGSTIAESLSSTMDDDTRADVGYYCHKHQHSSNSYSEQALTTVMALQDGISRFSQGEGDAKGGVGMMDMVEFTNTLGLTPVADRLPRICVISGRSCILFKNQYNNGVPQDQDGGINRRIQFFNGSNSIEESPEEAYVFELGHSFPGTVVSVRFTLDSEFMNTVVHQNARTAA